MNYVYLPTLKLAFRDMPVVSGKLPIYIRTTERKPYNDVVRFIEVSKHFDVPPSSVKRTPHGEIALMSKRKFYFRRFNEIEAVFDVYKKTVMFNLGADNMNPRTFVTMIDILIRAAGWTVLHASGVRVGDKVSIFCGVSGSGKSTNALDAVKKFNARLIADDRILIKRHRNYYEICPLPGEIELDSRHIKTRTCSKSFIVAPEKITIYLLTKKTTRIKMNPSGIFSHLARNSILPLNEIIVSRDFTTMTDLVSSSHIRSLKRLKAPI